MPLMLISTTILPVRTALARCVKRQ